MNTFEQHIGKQIRRILHLNVGEDFPPFPSSLGIYIMLEEMYGLMISFNFGNETISISYITLENLQVEYGVDFGESILNELETSDNLNQLIGQSIISIKVGEFKDIKLSGDNFVIKNNEYAGVIIQTTKNTILIHTTKVGGQIIFDKNELPSMPQNWIIQ